MPVNDIANEILPKTERNSILFPGRLVDDANRWPFYHIQLGFMECDDVRTTVLD